MKKNKKVVKEETDFYHYLIENIVKLDSNDNINEAIKLSKESQSSVLKSLFMPHYLTYQGSL